MGSRRLICVAWLLGAYAVACGARTDPGASGSAGGGSSGGAPPCDAGAGDSGTGDAQGGQGPGCPDGDLTEAVYVLDEGTVLYRYDPLTGEAIQLGVLDCGDEGTAWTMTATTDHAYIVYTDWSLYVVDLATLSCTPTAFQPGQLGLDYEFGVAAYGSGAGERLFYYGVPDGGSGAILAESDTSSFVLSKVGDVSPGQQPASFPVNLTADDAGHLYAFSPLGLVQEIDSASGEVLQAVDTGVVAQSTWATIAYGSELYLWVDGEVVGYDLASRARTSDRAVDVFAVGAGSFPACVGP